MEKKNPCKGAGFDECEDEADIENKYEFEAKDAFVQSIDGVFLEGDDEEIKLLFFYFNPTVTPLEDELVQCKCVAEFRASRTRFLEIVKNINIRADCFQRKSDNIMFA